MKGQFPTERFTAIETPFYYYDTSLLRQTIATADAALRQHKGYTMHYAVKANANPSLLRLIAAAGWGADCVSGGEIVAARQAGFPAEKILFAGVGKSDKEIALALREEIGCFNVESIAELEVIEALAQSMGKVARIALRVNPDVAVHTHSHIATGRAEDKFGIATDALLPTINQLSQRKNLRLVGLHFHVGSQIVDMSDFLPLCARINALQDRLAAQDMSVEIINVGGGLGVDYEHPNRHPIADFQSYFNTFACHLRQRTGQRVFFELGRAIVAPCGSLITRVLYVKQGATRTFCIVDAGFTDLIRPAFYGAYHKIENLSSDSPAQDYDIVGPICETSDVFATARSINAATRGDLIALRTAGAYGEVMASQYNCRPLPKGYTAEEI